MYKHGLIHVYDSILPLMSFYASRSQNRERCEESVMLHELDSGIFWGGVELIYILFCFSSFLSEDLSLPFFSSSSF